MQYVIDIQYRGPWFDSRGPRVLRRITRAIDRAVAELAYDEVMDKHVEEFKDPTGHYESLVAIDSRRGGLRVWDHDCIYGPWLEGIGSRNFPETRFRGYHGWRKAAQSTRRKAQRASERVVARFIRELN